MLNRRVPPETFPAHLEMRSESATACSSRAALQTSRAASAFIAAMPSPTMRSGHAARNARLYAAVTAAINETEIAVLEAKYHYQFWRPITAIRNGDRDNNPTTERDPDWTPSTVTPMNPEYPCGNCIIAATVAADRGSDAEAARGSEASRQTPPRRDPGSQSITDWGTFWGSDRPDCGNLQ
jgi:hypothetical protein